jgi:hypothetical protein
MAKLCGDIIATGENVFRAGASTDSGRSSVALELCEDEIEGGDAPNDSDFEAIKVCNHMALDCMSLIIICLLDSSSKQEAPLQVQHTRGLL